MARGPRSRYVTTVRYRKEIFIAVHSDQNGFMVSVVGHFHDKGQDNMLDGSTALGQVHEQRTRQL